MMAASTDSRLKLVISTVNSECVNKDDLNKEKQHFKALFLKENNFVRLASVGSSRLTVFTVISMIKLIFSRILGDCTHHSNY